MRLAERPGVDSGTASQPYFACLLFYVGCTADAEVIADLFEEDALLTHFAPGMFGSRGEMGLEPPVYPSRLRCARPGNCRLPTHRLIFDLGWNIGGSDTKAPPMAPNLWQYHRQILRSRYPLWLQSKLLTSMKTGTAEKRTRLTMQSRLVLPDIDRRTLFVGSS